MSSRSGRRSRSRSREPRRSGRRDEERPWLKRSRSRSSSSNSRSRSPRQRSRRSRSKSPVRPVMSKDPKYLNSRVFVANLASDKTSCAELLALFEKHGKVVDTLVHHNGYGFVQFTNEEDGRKAATAETGTNFHGKPLKCNMAAEGKKGGGGSGPTGGGRGPGDRFDRERSPGREHYPPHPYDDPYFRGRDLPPPPREMPLPPRDPFFDDPYRRPPPPDLYFDRFRDDPYRRDPYGLDPYRDPYRDPFGPSVFEPVAPKKPITVDCEIVIMSSELRRYADMVDNRLKNINLLTRLLVIREDRTIQQQVEEASARSCLFAVVINSQNEIHRSVTLNILHGVAQEHRNMPLDDAMALVARSFEKFLQAEKEKVAAENSKAPIPEQSLPSKDMSYLLNLLADNRQLTVDELDKVITYLVDRKEKLIEASGTATGPAGKVPVLTPQQQEQQQQQHLQSKILSMMNGASAAPAVPTVSLPKNTLASHAAALSARPPPPPQASISPSAAIMGGTISQKPLAAPSATASTLQGVASSATLINFDNPTVQKALDNLIQNGPNLLRNISATPKTQTAWPVHGTQASASRASSFVPAPQHQPY